MPKLCEAWNGMLDDWNRSSCLRTQHGLEDFISVKLPIEAVFLVCCHIRGGFRVFSDHVAANADNSIFSSTDLVSSCSDTPTLTARRDSFLLGRGDRQ